MTYILEWEIAMFHSENFLQILTNKETFHKETFMESFLFTEDWISSLLFLVDFRIYCMQKIGNSSSNVEQCNVESIMIAK